MNCMVTQLNWFKVISFTLNYSLEPIRSEKESVLPLKMHTLTAQHYDSEALKKPWKGYSVGMEVLFANAQMLTFASAKMPLTDCQVKDNANTKRQNSAMSLGVRS